MTIIRGLRLQFVTFPVQEVRCGPWPDVRVADKLEHAGRTVRRAKRRATRRIDLAAVFGIRQRGAFRARWPRPAPCRPPGPHWDAPTARGHGTPLDVCDGPSRSCGAGSKQRDVAKTRSPSIISFERRTLRGANRGRRRELCPAEERGPDRPNEPKATLT